MKNILVGKTKRAGISDEDGLRTNLEIRRKQQSCVKEEKNEKERRREEEQDENKKKTRTSKKVKETIRQTDKNW